MNDPWVVAGKIAEALDALNGKEPRPSVSALREEIARLKAINAKLGGTAAKKTAEISELREANRKLGEELNLTTQRMGDMEVELNAKLDEARKAQTRGGQDEEIRDLREELHFKSIEIKELSGRLGRVQKASEQISKNNASLREQLEYQTKASRRHQSIAHDLAGVVNEVRRALNDYDNEED